MPAMKRREFLIIPLASAGGTAMMGAVLEHLVQSIEMSIDGFPQPRSALFQGTVA